MSTRYVWQRYNTEYTPQVVGSGGPSLRYSSSPIDIFVSETDEGIFTNWYDNIVGGNKEYSSWTRYDEHYQPNPMLQGDYVSITIPAGNYFCYSSNVSNGLPIRASNYYAVSQVVLRAQKLGTTDFRLSVYSGNCQEIEGVLTKGDTPTTVSNRSSSTYPPQNYASKSARMCP